MSNVTKAQALETLKVIRLNAALGKTSVVDVLTEDLRAFIEGAPEKGGEIARLAKEYAGRAEALASAARFARAGASDERAGEIFQAQYVHCDRIAKELNALLSAHPAAAKEPVVTEDMRISALLAWNTLLTNRIAANQSHPSPKEILDVVLTAALAQQQGKGE